MSDYATDLARLAIFILYGLTIGHVAWIIRTFARYARRALPRHITLVGIAFIFALTEVVWQNAIRVGRPFSWYLVVNLVIMAISLHAMRDMRKHILRGGVQSRHTERRSTDT